MTEQLLISVEAGLVRAVRTVDGRAQAYHCERRDRRNLAGNVYRGRVARVAASLNAAFVDCGLERAAFMVADDAPGDAGRIEQRCHEGQTLTVQVVHDAAPGKGPRVSARLSLAGRYAVYRPTVPGVAVSRRIGGAALRARLAAAAARLVEAHGGGALLRTNAACVATAAVEADLLALVEKADSLSRSGVKAPAPALREPGPVERLLRDVPGARLAAVIIDDDTAWRAAVRHARCAAPDLVARLRRHSGPRSLFESHGVADDIDCLLEPQVPLAGGGAIMIEATRGLCAIDVDSGRFVGRAGPRAALSLNIEAAWEIARQLRLRNIAGLVAIDFVGMGGRADAAALARALRDAVAMDSAAVRMAPLSPFGVVELTRRRIGPSLAELLTERCAACDGGGRRRTAFAMACDIARAALAEARARPGRRLAIHAPPDVIAALDGPVGEAIEAACGLSRRARPGWPRERFEIVGEGGA